MHLFPGQGAIVDTMQLLAKTGLDQLIKDWIHKDRPFFGICLGFQALFEFSEEGDTQGLGIFEGTVKRFPPASETQLKVPHMGWNSVSFNDDSALTMESKVVRINFILFTVIMWSQSIKICTFRNGIW